MSERQFSIQNTLVANSLVQVIGGAEWIPEITTDTIGEGIQFTNIEVIQGWYTRIGKVINFNLVFTCDIAAPIAERVGIFELTAPELHIDIGAVAGSVGTVDAASLAGTVSHVGDKLHLNILKSSDDAIGVTDAIMNVSGSYLIN